MINVWVSLIAVCATILLVGIASAVYGYTRPPTYDIERADMFFVVGIGMIFLGALTTTLLVVTIGGIASLEVRAH